ncbi:MAG: hypothetical protein ABI560_06620 [Myxococcales bacterium]
MQKPRRTRLAITSCFIAGGIVSIALGLAKHSNQTAGTAAAAVLTSRPHPLKGVAAIVEADIVSTKYVYDETLGPRAEFALANVVVHAGKLSDLKTLSQFGGPLPDGTQIVTSDLPTLTPGARYILFLGSAPWFYTPVWTYLCFRVETIAGRSVVVGPGGFPVTSFGKAGVTFAQTKVLDLSGPNDPSAPRTLLPNVSSADPGLAEAVDHDTFLRSAIEAASSSGADFNVTVPTAPELLGGSTKWNVVQGTSLGSN